MQNIFLQTCLFIAGLVVQAANFLTFQVGMSLRETFQVVAHNIVPDAGYASNIREAYFSQFPAAEQMVIYNAIKDKVLQKYPDITPTELDATIAKIIELAEKFHGSVFQLAKSIPGSPLHLALGAVTSAPVPDPTNFSTMTLQQLIEMAQNKMAQTGIPMPVATGYSSEDEFKLALIAYLQQATENSATTTPPDIAPVSTTEEPVVAPDVPDQQG